MNGLSAHNDKCAQTNLGRGPRRGGLSGPWAVQHCDVAYIDEYASCPSAAAAAVIAARSARVCCLHSSFGRRIVTFLLISHKPRRWSRNRIHGQKAQESSFPTITLSSFRIRIGNISPSDRPTDGPTDRSSTGKFDDYRPLRSESDAA